MFTNKSRYKNTELFLLKDRQGRNIKVVGVPSHKSQLLLGYHPRKQGQRLDHLASHYLNDDTGFWRICQANDAMLPEALSEQVETAIPTK